MQKIAVSVDQLEKKQRIQQQARELINNCHKFSWQIIKLFGVLSILRQPQVRKGAFLWLKGYLVDYRKFNRLKNKSEINTFLPIDSKIPFRGSSLADYLSHVGFYVAGVHFLRKEFGKTVDSDISQSLQHIAELFSEAMKVFKEAQTSFDRGKQRGLKFKILRFFDKNRNSAPSLHVEIVAFTYFNLSGIIDKQAGNFKDLYEPIKKALFQRAIRILEAVFLVKQHTVMDVGLGFAALSGKENSFNQEHAFKMIDTMFKENNYGINETVLAELRTVIKNIYNEVMAKIIAQPIVPPSQILIEYLRNFQKSTKV